MSHDPVDIIRAEACALIARTATNLTDSTTARDEAIMHGRAVGLSLRTIATLAGVSPQTVLNIVARYEATS